MKKIIKIIISISVLVIVALSIIFCFYFVGKAPISDNIVWGVDFSQMQAQSLKLNWKEVYIAIMDDLGVKSIKLHNQWDWIEGEKDKYYFDDADWQINQAKERGIDIIYVLGMKSGRWPECHAPKWTNYLSVDQQKEELLKYIEETVQRYKNESNIIYWQVENEPLFKFGECPDWYYDNDDFLKREVALVKSLDPSRKIIISDSGEQSSWFSAAKTADIVGITMYREVWAHIADGWGFYFKSFLSPVTYWRKALIIKEVFGKDVFCIELQAEPWASKPFYDVPLSEQTKSMDLETFKQNVQYARETGFNKFYFWGTEWWYWMKTKQNQPQIWDEAKKIFSE